ncbi:unnamed protein product, partial [Staurois parvus]
MTRDCGHSTVEAPPFVASVVNHRVPDSDYSLAPGAHRVLLTGERTVCKQY